MLAPRYLGLRLVLARGYARIHWQNLVNFGVLPVECEQSPGEPGDRLAISDLSDQLHRGDEITVRNECRDTTIRARHRLSPRQVETMLAGGRIPAFKRSPARGDDSSG